jgi:hypothetical protein
MQLVRGPLGFVMMVVVKGKMGLMVHHMMMVLVLVLVLVVMVLHGRLSGRKGGRKGKA